jgi:hydroxyacylglutathione hydrolase
MIVKCFEFNMLPVNTYVMWNPDDREAVIIDPGCYFSGETDILKKYIDENHLTVRYLLNTHLHFDHIFGNPFVENTFHIKAKANDGDMKWLLNIKKRVALFGMRYDETVNPIENENILKEGDTVSFGSTDLLIFHIPGHSPGSIVFYSSKDKMIFTGDVLFQGSIGRSDFPDGDANALTLGIRSKLFVLPDETVVYPGHGPATTIGYEKEYNRCL